MAEVEDPLVAITILVEIDVKNHFKCWQINPLRGANYFFMFLSDQGSSLLLFATFHFPVQMF